MSTTRHLLAALPYTSQVRELAEDIATAAGRAAKSDPGDRSDVARYERLCTSLEAAAWLASQQGSPTLALTSAVGGPGLPVAAVGLDDSAGTPLLERLPLDASAAAQRWLANGYAAVALAIRLQLGDSPPIGAEERPPGVSDTWRAPSGEEGARAVEARFRSQVEAALGAARGRTREALDPSGVHNRVLTQVLRRYVQGSASARVDAPIAYRDGSAASHPFPLRCLPLAAAAPQTADVDLHLSLLSIRHTDMDPVTDGAWLRNAEVSRPRPAGQTDDFVYATSLAQLDALTDRGRRTARLRIYQTGLDTAVVGFYRAVTVHLLEHPGSLAVVPLFAASPHSNRGDSTVFRPGQPWCTEGAS